MAMLVLGRVKIGIWKLSHDDFQKGTVDGSARKPPGMYKKNLVNNGINYQPQLLNAGFLNHQQPSPFF